MTLDNNNAVLTDLLAFFSLNTLPHRSTSVGLTGCISFGFSVLHILTHLTTMMRVGHFNKLMGYM